MPNKCPPDTRLPIGATAQQRQLFTKTGEKPKAAKLVLTLDGIRINELTTADIRSWHRLVVQEVGQYSVKKPPLGWSMYQLVASNKAAPPIKAMGVKNP